MTYSAEHAFLQFMRASGKSLTEQRAVIVRTFLETEGHFTADDFAAMVRRQMPELGQATVYRTLKLLVESGLADAFDPGDGVTLYEHKFGHEHHDHLICTRCGRTIEVRDEEIERRQRDITASHGFKPTRHRMYLYGLCPDCRETD